MKTFMLTYYHESDFESVRAQINDQNGIVFSVVRVPFWNVYGQIVSHEYAVVYQAHKEISVETLT
jgi:hypothetical protein